MNNKNVIIILVAAALCVAATILFNFDPEAVRFYPRCPSKLLSGYDCPGCGSLRALHALLHGEVSRAWHFNPALFFAIPAIIFFSFSSQYRVGGLPWRICYSRFTPWAIIVITLFWWIARNIF